MTLQPKRTVAELKELHSLTGDKNGAQRVCWTETWAKARAWMRDKLAALPVEVIVDEAGNQWAILRGKSDKALLIGGHIDSVPNGGRLDGSLNMPAGLLFVQSLRGLSHTRVEDTKEEHLELSVQALDRLAGSAGLRQ